MQGGEGRRGIGRLAKPLRIPVYCDLYLGQKLATASGLRPPRPPLCAPEYDELIALRLQCLERTRHLLAEELPVVGALGKGGAALGVDQGAVLSRKGDEGFRSWVYGRGTEGRLGGQGGDFIPRVLYSHSVQ